MPMPQKAAPVTEVLLAFLRLGCLSFGGPVAHLGYFHAEFVERRRWCSSDNFAELVALAQSLPGPASSQVAFALGLLRGRLIGGLAAWVGFTIPSALLMFTLACGHDLFTGRFGIGVLHGLQVAAVAIVAQAVLAMQRSLAPDPYRLALAVAAAAIALLSPGSFDTPITIFLAALIGLALPQFAPAARPAATLILSLTRKNGLAAGAVFLLLLVGLPAIAGLTRSPALDQATAFYRTGALVFGGGHVVLPLLERAVVAPGWVSQSTFLAGYGSAQAVPGPLFTFAAFLGASLKDPATGAVPSGLAARAGRSALALVAIFLPGLLLMFAALPWWAALSGSPRLHSAIRAVNAAVVGVLFAALVQPVAATAIGNYLDLALAAAALFALIRLKWPPWLVVAATVLVVVVPMLVVVVPMLVVVVPLIGSDHFQGFSAE